MYAFGKVPFSSKEIRMRLSKCILSLMVGLPACGVASWCQLAPSPDAAPESIAPASPDVAPDATFKQTVNLVDVFFTVRDEHGNLVSHLSQQNCAVKENNEPQTLKSFVAETDQPLNLGILLDTSVSQITWLPTEQDMGSQFVRQVLRSEDQAFLLSFDADIDLLQDYTNSPHLLMHALSKAQINRGGDSPTVNDPLGIPIYHPKVDPGPAPISHVRGTLFYDAIYRAASEKMTRETGRKAIVVLTDGDDQGSTMRSRDAIAAAEKNNVILYVVWVGDHDACFNSLWTPLSSIPTSLPSPQTPRLLDDPAWSCNRIMYWWARCPGYYVARCMSEQTGGRFIDVGNSRKQLETAFQQIQDELRTQYWAGYIPSNMRADGGFRKIAVECHGDDSQELKVRVRTGYYAPSAGTKPPP